MLLFLIFEVQQVALESVRSVQKDNFKNIDLVMAISEKLILSLKIKNIKISENNPSHQSGKISNSQLKAGDLSSF